MTDHWEKSHSELLLTLATAIAGLESSDDLASSELIDAKEKAISWLEHGMYGAPSEDIVETHQPQIDSFELIGKFCESFIHAEELEDLSDKDFANSQFIAQRLSKFMAEHMMAVTPFASQIGDMKNSKTDTNKLRKQLLAEAMGVLLPNKTGPASIENSLQIAVHLDVGFKWALKIEKGLLEGKSQSSTIKLIQQEIDAAEHSSGNDPTDISVEAIKQRAKNYRSHAKQLIKEYR